MPILTGLAIGAALGGGIAALRGGRPEDILKGAVIGGATGAIGGGISGALQAGTAGSVAASGADAVATATPVTLSPLMGETFTQSANQGIYGLVPNAGITVNGTQLIGNQVPSAISTLPMGSAPLSPAATTLVSPTTTTSQAVGTGFFDSGIGKTLYDNKGILGAGALGLMALKPQSSTGSKEEPGYIRPYTFNQTRNPAYAGAGTPYFNQSYTAQAPVKASGFGATAVANGGIIRMAEGGETPEPATTQEQRENVVIPTLGQLAAIQQAQQPYQPPMVAQGMTQPLIAPQMATVQQRYAPVQRQAPEAFNYQNNANVNYGGAGNGGIYYGGGATGGYNDAAAQAAAAAAAAGGTGGAESDINRLYKELLGRAPDPTGIAANKGASAATIRQSILDSAEYKAKNPSGGGGGIASLYQELLGRAPDPTGIAANAGQSDETIRQSILNSAEYNNKNPSGSIGNLYQELLGRAPDPTGIAANAGQSEQTIRESIMASPEYQALHAAPAGAYQTIDSETGQSYNPYPGYVGQYYDGGSGGGDADGGLMSDKHPSYAMGNGIGGYYPSPDDGTRNYNAQEFDQGPQYPMQQGQYSAGGMMNYAGGGITNTRQAAVQAYAAKAQSSPQAMKELMAKAQSGDYDAMLALNSLQGTPNQNYAGGGGIYNLGGYSDGGRLLKGPGDGVSDSIPAQIGQRQPARLADGEFVVPARTVSELGNGSTDAGAKQLYAMMDRVQKNRAKTIGKGKIAVDSKSSKYLPA